ncbi:unnamed protein product [Prunus armeniaca]|uniref:Uncharacterized protein n=1 Tax=Prunus armeniaca TaxID=36596 RepID=A0A6J5TYN8_PRUAR|nr:unnamed protein product [Prunus armeniaca]
MAASSILADLWEAVEATAEPPKGEDQDSDDRLKTWRKKNAAALHTIQISCGPEAFSVIRDMTSAKIAWDTLAERLTPQPLLPCNSPVQSANSSNNLGILDSLSVTSKGADHLRTN